MIDTINTTLNQRPETIYGIDMGFTGSVDFSVMVNTDMLVANGPLYLGVLSYYHSMLKSLSAKCRHKELFDNINTRE